ncbi:CoA transferase [Thermanaerosceptrum fracticalcis]|uniref:CoA transferase n=1 Tax=Thermanaerosceptrum fracticalcis TaxID=1712410 RepID=A0A7G6E538_THEFR|nr:CaiB/BaiF CoA-transferase family protein [Thermanaerosceptrum fracticalcis]QNB47192.1 CoA transferase [Thermanaerosceptrum fracticalcis]
MAPPLEGIKVLDLSLFVPGPFSTMMLADFGAEVIKIEQPDQGDFNRDLPPLLNGVGYRHLILNRNKKSMTLNLKSEEGKKVFYRLVRTADVIIENCRPGVTSRLGIDYNTVKEINPQIVYCSITGFGQTGPNRMVPAQDLNIMAYSGVLSLTGKQNGSPFIPGMQIADMASAMMAVNGILLALYSRQKTGLGQYIDISMLDSVISMLPSDTSFYLGSGKVPLRGETRLTGTLPNYNIYKTKDDRYLAVAALNKNFWVNLCNLIGHPEIANDLNIEEKNQVVFDILRGAFAKKTLSEWLTLFKDSDTCVSPVNNIDEVLTDPQIIERQMLIDMDDEKSGNYKQIGNPIKLSGTPFKLYNRAPELGENTIEVLRECGYDEDEILNLKNNGVI